MVEETPYGSRRTSRVVVVVASYRHVSIKTVGSQATVVSRPATVPGTVARLREVLGGVVVIGQGVGVVVPMTIVVISDVVVAVAVVVIVG